MALMETKIVIVMLLQKYTFTVPPFLFVFVLLLLLSSGNSPDLTTSYPCQIPDEEVDKITYSRMITLSLKNGKDICLLLSLESRCGSKEVLLTFSPLCFMLGPNSHSLWMKHRKRHGPPSTQ
jgi:hypothetical protein